MLKNFVKCVNSRNYEGNFKLPDVYTLRVTFNVKLKKIKKNTSCMKKPKFTSDIESPCIL